MDRPRPVMRREFRGRRKLGRGSSGGYSIADFRSSTEGETTSSSETVVGATDTSRERYERTRTQLVDRSARTKCGVCSRVSEVPCIKHCVNNLRYLQNDRLHSAIIKTAQTAPKDVPILPNTADPIMHVPEISVGVRTGGVPNISKVGKNPGVFYARCAN